MRLDILYLIRLLCSPLSAQRKTVHTDWGEAAQRIQEGWEYLQTADAGGQRGGQQHMERKLHPADVGLCVRVVLQIQLFFSPCVLFLFAHVGAWIMVIKASRLWFSPG